MSSAAVPARSLADGLLSPAEVADALRCSEWWVKEQARRRRIPYAWIGGSYRFTPEHVAEIIKSSEVRPIEVAPPPPAPRAPARRVRSSLDTASRLTARRPKRALPSSPLAAEA